MVNPFTNEKNRERPSKQSTLVIERPFQYSPHALLTKLNSSKEKGLSTEEAHSRLEGIGLNKIEHVKPSRWKVYIAPISNWLIDIYLGAALLIFLLSLSIPPRYVSPLTNTILTRQDVFLTIIPWFIVIGVNAIVAVIQQYRGQKKLEAIRELVAQRTTVVRNSEEQRINASELVPGDVVILSQGDKVPADCFILESHSLAVNEASLTGESMPIKKTPSKTGLEGTTPLQERSNMVFMGTFVTRGSARCLVANTGSYTNIGKLNKKLEEITTDKIPIKDKVNTLAKYLGIAVFALLIVSSFIRTISLWRLVSKVVWPDIAYVLIQGIILALSIMPINIILLVTIVLLTGILAMAKKNVIVRDLSAVETLGRVSVVCADKTGTMTKNKMTVKKIWDCSHLYGATGTGYEKEGMIVRIEHSDATKRLRESSDMTPLQTFSIPLELILVNGFLNNEARVSNGEIIGDPTDGACKVLFYKSKLQEEETIETFELTKIFPFDSALKRMSKVYQKSDHYWTFTKGATEEILAHCDHIFQGNQTVELTPQKRKEVLNQVNKFGEEGYRVISFAYKPMEPFPNQPEDSPRLRERVETNLVYCGFVCIVDPPRTEVYESVKDCQSAGIDVIMITGDSPATARSIAKELDILEEEKNQLVVEGKNIHTLSEEEFQRTKVFARVSPDDKQKIVKRYQDQDKTVAMTGDGVNDALALSMSDCSLAMGIEGTDVAKQASDIIISDDSFSSIRTGVEEGRNLVAKIKALCYFYICVNLMETTVLFSLFFLFGISDPTFTPFLNYQLQWLYVTCHTFPGFALIIDTTSHTVMQEAPRNTEEIITKDLLKMLLLHAAIMAITILTLYITTYTGLYPLFPGNHAVTPVKNLRLAKARTLSICTILFSESIIPFSVRRMNLSIIETNKPEEFSFWIYLFTGMILLGTIGLIYVPSIQQLAYQLTNGIITFNFIWLTSLDWLIIILATLPAVIGVEIYKLIQRKKGKRF